MLTDEGRPGKIYCNLCATWLSSKGAVWKDHVLGKNTRNSDGELIVSIQNGCRQNMLSSSELCTHIPNVPQSEWVRYMLHPPRALCRILK